MSALCKSLDNLQVNEKNNLEYSWSNNIEELLLQFSFQLTRTTNTEKLEEKYDELLNKIFTQDLNFEYIKIIYKLIGHTRDIISGKGECNLTYMLISKLYKFSQSENLPVNYKYPIQAMATSAVESLIRTDLNEHPYGSWKDMKYFCNYHVDKKDRYNYQYTDGIFSYVIDLICGQLRNDEHCNQKSLAAKWVPREKSSKFGWITPILAMRYYSPWMKLDGKNLLTPDDPQYKFARRKCLTHFRKLLAKINNELNTTQINQCNETWHNIDFDKNVTSITMRKQSKAFMCIKKNGQINEKLFNNDDRAECRNNYKKYIEECLSGKKKAKGKCVSLIDFVKAAINTNKNFSTSQEEQFEKDSINMQWNNNAEQNKQLENCIAMVDTSASMESDNSNPLYSALALGIRIAEKSKFGKRVLTFHANPSWINLDDCNDFVSMVHKIRDIPWGMNTNFRGALELILNTAISNNINPDDMKKMTLIILSDMQIDSGETNNSVMFDMMKIKYHDAGLQTIYKTPYELPHIIFWNLRSTSGFPSLSKTENTSMISGNSPALLNTFSSNGIDALNDMTPWKMLLQQLSNKRYDHLEKIVINIWRYVN